MKRLFIIALLFAVAVCPAAETLRASLLFSFSPDSQVEFVRGKPQLRSVSDGKVLLAQIARQYSRRAAEKGGDTTPSLRKAVVVKLIEAYRQVNAAVRIVPMPEIEQAIQDVCGIIEHYKLVASEAKHRKGDEPEPGPEPEPNRGAAAS